MVIEDELIERLIEYVKFDTQSNSKSETTPSTEKQKELGSFSAGQLKGMGLSTEMCDHGYVYACLKSNLDEGEVPALGFVAHLDTSPAEPGKNVNPRIHRNYGGGDIVLEGGVTIQGKDLVGYVGDTLITSNGATLLGGDDKAGMDVIVTGIDHIIKSNVKHGDIYVMFMPDEEIRIDLREFDPDKFPVQSAYTLDREGNCEIDNENFNAAAVKVTIKGHSAHPGLGGKDIINALQVASDFHAQIPFTQRPEASRDKQGFYHLTEINGTVAEATMFYDVRDFDKEELNRKIKYLGKIATFLNAKYQGDFVNVHHDYMYSNMKEGLDKHPGVVEIAYEAAKKAGVDPVVSYVRGGIVGATLIEKFGIPCPNLFCGQGKPHQTTEFVSVKGMVDATKTLINIVEGHREYHLSKTG